MAPASLPLPDPTAVCVPYDQATPQQLSRVLSYVTRELSQHFPTLDFITWANELLWFRPNLWVSGEEVSLDYADLEHLTQRLASSAQLPELDPPIYPHRAAYLAKRLINYQDEALEALAELAANPLAYGNRVFNLVVALALGNATADVVFRATHPAPPTRPGDADPALARTTASQRVQALRQARGELGYPDTTPPSAGPSPDPTPGQ